MRFHVYYTLVQLAGKTEQTGAIFTDVETVKSQFSAVPPSNEQMQKLLRLLHEVLLTCKKSDEASAVSEPALDGNFFRLLPFAFISSVPFLSGTPIPAHLYR